MAAGLVVQDGMPGRTFIRNLLHFIQRIEHLSCTRLANQYADSCPVSISISDGQRVCATTFASERKVEISRRS
jgi:hypothetical protein